MLLKFPPDALIWLHDAVQGTAGLQLYDIHRQGFAVVKCGCDVMCLQCRALGTPKGIEW